MDLFTKASRTGFALLSLAACAALGHSTGAQPASVRRPLADPVAGELDAVLVPIALEGKWETPWRDPEPARIQVFEDGVEQELIYVGRPGPLYSLQSAFRARLRAALKNAQASITVRVKGTPMRNAAEKLTAWQGLAEWGGQGSEAPAILYLESETALLQPEGPLLQQLKRGRVFDRTGHGATINRAYLEPMLCNKAAMPRVVVVLAVPSLLYPYDCSWTSDYNACASEPRARYPEKQVDYLLGYRPTNPLMDGKKREVRIVLHFADPKKTKVRAKAAPFYRMPG